MGEQGARERQVSLSADHQKIAIRQGMSEVQTVSATVHEIAHSKLHNQKKIQIANDEQYQAVSYTHLPSEKVWGHRLPVPVFWKSWYLPVFWNEKRAGKRCSFSLPTMQSP